MEDLDTFEPNVGHARIEMDRRSVVQAVAAGVLDVDEQRTRSRYADGQVLGAEGFRRDQALFDRRQRDLGRIVERGVVEGLEVRQAFVLDDGGLETDELDPTQLVIDPGHGVTRAGHTVVLRDRVEIDLTQLPIFQQLDAVFVLDRRPRAPARTQSGVFALTLRPVEYTANPVAPYPRDITGERRLEDGDNIEATVVTLVPLETESSLDGVDAGPAALAHRVFARGLDPLTSDYGLPIAIVALDRGQLAWIDVDLARRRAMADPGHGFGAGARADLEAHMRHFERRMDSIIARRLADGLGTRFSASDYFEVLPPAGELPAAAVSIHGDRVVQWFFPPDVEAELVLVPHDELSSLFEEAMALGVYDLSQGAKIAEATPMSIVVTVPRDDFAATALALGGVLSRPIAPRLGSYARRRPVDALLRRFQRPAALPAGPIDPALLPWDTLLSAATSVFYVRQRRRPRTSFALARSGPLPIEQRPSGTLPALVRSRIDAAGELARFDQLLVDAEAGSLERLELSFTLPLFGADPTFVNAVMAELSARRRRRLLEPGEIAGSGVSGVPVGAPAALRERPLTLADVERIAGRYEAPAELGQGLAAMRALEPDLAEFEHRLVIAQTLSLRELDERIRETPTDAHDGLAAQLLALCIANDVNGIRDLVGYVRAEPPALPLPRYSNGAASTGFANAVAIGQGALFTILWNHGDDDVRGVLDALLGGVHSRQPLVATVLMMGLLHEAWQLAPRTPDDVWLLVEHLYRWPFTPAQPLSLPTLERGGEVLIRRSIPRIGGYLTVLEDAEQSLIDSNSPGDGLDYAQTSNLLEANGFPPAGLEAADAYRILGTTFRTVQITFLTGAVEAFLEPEFPAYVAALSEAVRAADIPAMERVRDEWTARL